MIKKYNNFIKESLANKGKGPGNDDLFISAPKRQTINQSNQTADFLRIGKHIKTNKIDGFIDSIQNNTIFIVDRLSGEIQKYNLRDVLKGIKKEEKIPSTVQGFEGIPAWAKKQKIYENLEEDDDFFFNEDDDDEDVLFNNSLQGTEDNPLGLPNKGTSREMPNENSSYLRTIKEDLSFDDEDDEEQEFEIPLIRGTEDNPLPTKKRRVPKIESYE